MFEGSVGCKLLIWLVWHTGCLVKPYVIIFSIAALAKDVISLCVHTEEALDDGSVAIDTPPKTILDSDPVSINFAR